MKKNLTLLFSLLALVLSIFTALAAAVAIDLGYDNNNRLNLLEQDAARSANFVKTGGYRYGRDNTTFRFRKENQNGTPRTWVPGIRISSTTKKGMECRRFNGRMYCRERARKYKRSTTPACKCECNCVPKCNSI